MSALASIVIGLHVTTAHFDAAPGATLQDRNPGVYVRADSGLTLGAYRNSIGRDSVHAGWTWETSDRRWALTAGVVSGYDLSRVGPLLVPSVRLGPVRLSYLAKARRDGSQGVHLSLEKQL